MPDRRVILPSVRLPCLPAALLARLICRSPATRHPAGLPGGRGASSQTPAWAWLVASCSVAASQDTGIGLRPPTNAAAHWRSPQIFLLPRPLKAHQLPCQPPYRCCMRMRLPATPNPPPVLGGYPASGARAGARAPTSTDGGFAPASASASVAAAPAYLVPTMPSSLAYSSYRRRIVDFKAAASHVLYSSRLPTRARPPAHTRIGARVLPTTTTSGKNFRKGSN